MSISFTHVAENGHKKGATGLAALCLCKKSFIETVPRLEDRVLFLTETLCLDGFCFLPEISNLTSIFDDLLRESCSEFERSVLVERVIDSILRLYGMTPAQYRLHVGK